MKPLHKLGPRLLLLACALLGAAVPAHAVRLESLGTIVPSGREMNIGLLQPERFTYDNLRGYLIVANSEAEQVAILDRQGVAIKVLGKTKRLGPPVAVAVTNEGTLYLAERESDALRVLRDYDSVSHEEYRTLELGRYARGAMVQPIALFIDADRNLYVADKANHQVLVFGPDEKYKFSLPNVGAPTDVKVSGAKIYVSDPGFGGIRVFDMKGKKLATLGTTPAQFREPLRVKALAIDRRERIWALDESGQSMECMDSLGNVLFTTTPPEPWFPVDIVIDLEDNVYLLDRAGRGVAAFRILEF